jgi:hypothetical protein
MTGGSGGDLGNQAPTNQNLRLELDRFKRSSLQRSTDIHGLAVDSETDAQTQMGALIDTGGGDAIRESRIAPLALRSLTRIRTPRGRGGNTASYFREVADATIPSSRPVTYGYAVGHAGLQGCVALGAGSVVPFISVALVKTPLLAGF